MKRLPIGLYATLLPAIIAEIWWLCVAARTASEGATTAASGTVPAGVGTAAAGGRMASAVAGRRLLSASFGYVVEKQPARRLLSASQRLAVQLLVRWPGASVCDNCKNARLRCRTRYVDAGQLKIQSNRNADSTAPIASCIALEPNVGFRGTAEVAGALQG
jgi:hypothetical protein